MGRRKVDHGLFGSVLNVVFVMVSVMAESIGLERMVE